MITLLSLIDGFLTLISNEELNPIMAWAMDHDIFFELKLLLTMPGEVILFSYAKRAWWALVLVYVCVIIYHMVVFQANGRLL